MTTIGYATLQIIPSLEGVSAAIDRQLGGNLVASGRRGGVQLGKGIAAGVKASEADVKRAFDAHAKMADKAADATGRLKVAQAGYEELVKKGVQSGQRFERAKAAVEKATRDETRSIKEATAALRQYEDTAKDAAKAGDKVGSGLMSGLQRATSGAGSRGDDLGRKFMGAFAGVVSVAAFTALAAKGARAYVDTFQSIMNTGLDFSRTLNNFQGVTRASAGELQNMKEAARALGADTTLAGVSASDAAKAMTELAKAGFSVDQAIGAARGTMQLATAGQIEAAQAAEIQANAMNAFGLSAESAAHTADLLANAAIASSADIPDLGLALQQVGGIAHGFGESLDDTVAALALFANAGIKGNDAGTLLKTTMQSITDQGGPAQGAIEALGLELYKLDGAGDKVFVGFRELFRQLDVAKKSMSSERFQAFANVLFGSDAMRAAMLGNADAFDVMLDKMQRTGAASEMAAAQMKGLPGAVESFKNSTESLKLTAFEQLGPAVTEMINKITASVQSHGPEIVQVFLSITDAVTGAAESVINDTGRILEVFGALVGGIGNVQGSVLKFESWQAKLRGDNQLADELHKQSEEAFGWGESLKKSGKEMQDFHGLSTTLKNDFKAVGDAAKGSAGNVDKFAEAAAKIAASPSPGWFGQAGATGALPAFSASGISASAIGTPLYTGGATSNTGGGVTPGLAALEQAVKGQFPGATISNDYRQPDGFNEHSSGTAVDIAVNPGGALGAKTDQGQALGSQVNQWLLANSAALGLEYTIWQGKQWNPDGSTSPNSGAGVTGGHWDHVHAKVSQKGASTLAPLANIANRAASGGQKVPDWDAIAANESGTPGQPGTGRWQLPSGDRDSTGGLQIRQGTWNDFGGQQYAPSPWQASKEQQIAVAEKILAAQGPQAWAGGSTFVWKNTGGGTPAGSGFAPAMVPITGGSSALDLSKLAGSGPLVNAFGPGYEPGIGTPGYNEYGDPGYWRTDPKAVRAAERAQADSQQAITDADERIADAKKRRADLEEDLTTTAEQRLKADKEITLAERAANRAREDAELAKEAVAEAQKGRFTEAKKESAKAKGKGSGFSLSSSLSGMGSALGEFAGGQLGSALDVFGVGDSPGWLNGISTFLGGMSIGGSGDSGGLIPIASMPSMAGVSGAEAMHGGTGAQPGPAGATYNIRTATVEDAFLQARRQEDLRMAAKLARF